MKLTLYSAVFSAALMCQSASAQTAYARAYIPFSFQVGTATMPAGQYSFLDSQGTLRIAETEGKKAVFHLTNHASRPNKTKDSKLVFTRYGDRLYLTSIWPDRTREGRALTLGKHEREAVKRFNRFQMAEIAMKPAS